MKGLIKAVLKLRRWERVKAWTGIIGSSILLSILSISLWIRLR